MKTKRRIKKRYILVGIIVLAIVALIIFRKNSTGSNPTYIVERQDVADTLILAGTIDVDQRVDLGFADSGRVSDIYVQEGQEVKKGQTIARIDQNRLQASLIQAQASKLVTELDTFSENTSVSTDLQTIQRQQDTLVQGAYQNYLSGDLQAYLIGEANREIVAPTISGTYLGTQEGEYHIEVYASSSNSGYSFRLSGLESGTYTAEAYQSGALGSKGLFISFDKDSQYSRTSWTIPVPNQRSSSYLTRKTAYENAQATREQVINAAQNNLDRVTGSSKGIDRSEAQVQQAQAQVNAVYAQLNDGKITAPFSGIIARNDLEIGEIITAFDPKITLFGSTQRQLELNVPEIYINKVEVGNTVSISLDAYPDEEFSGTVDSIDIIDTVVDGVPVYQTIVLIDQEDPRIRVGMNAKARIVAQEQRDVLAVPKHFLTLIDETYSVSVRESGDLKLIPVEIGFEGNDGLVEIITGVQEGMEIVRPDNLNKQS